MAFKKGESGNLAGKPPGTKSKKTLEWEEFGRELLEKGMPRALDILSTCEDEDFMNNFTSLIEYFKPKLARTELSHKGEQTITVKFIEDGSEDNKS